MIAILELIGGGVLLWIGVCILQYTVKGWLERRAQTAKATIDVPGGTISQYTDFPQSPFPQPPKHPNCRCVTPGVIPGDSHDTEGCYAGQGADVCVMMLAKPAERYLFIFDDNHRDELVSTLGRFADNPELSFNWHDAKMLATRLDKV